MFMRDFPFPYETSNDLFRDETSNNCEFRIYKVSSCSDKSMWTRRNQHIFSWLEAFAQKPVMKAFRPGDLLIHVYGLQDRVVEDSYEFVRRMKKTLWGKLVDLGKHSNNRNSGKN